MMISCRTGAKYYPQTSANNTPSNCDNYEVMMHYRVNHRNLMTLELKD